MWDASDETTEELESMMKAFECDWPGAPSFREYEEAVAELQQRGKDVEAMY